MKKFTELTKKSEKELQKMLAEEEQKLYDLRLKVSVNQLTEIRQIRKTRKRIAQIKTRLNQLKQEESTN